MTLTLELSPAELEQARAAGIDPAYLTDIAREAAQYALAGDDVFSQKSTEDDHENADLVARLIAADEEAHRVGFISLEDAIAQSQADREPGWVDRLKARLAGEGIEGEGLARFIGAGPGATA